MRTRSVLSRLVLSAVVSILLIASSALAADATSRKTDPKKAKDGAPRIPADLRIRKDIIFKATPAGSNEVLDLWLFEPLVQKYPRAPLVVYIHGGGWGGGDKLRVFRPDTIEVIRELNRQGIACATIEYRLANGGAANAYDSAADCKDAVRFLAKNADRFGLDPARIGTFGGSAGGHLTLVTALGADADYPCDPTLNETGATIRCVAAYYPATTFLHSETMKGSNFERPQRLIPILGGPLEEKRAIAVKLSPVELVRRGSPPIFLAHGDNDTVLSHRHSEQLRDVAEQRGVPVECVISRGAGHGFSGAGIAPDIAEINRRTVGFFLKHLASP